MINKRLLTGLLSGVLCSVMMYSSTNDTVRKVYTLEELFQIALINNTSIKVSESALKTSELGLKSANDNRIPDIKATANLRYIGDGFTTGRHFHDYQRAEIPHFGNGLTISAEQPLYTGGAITSSIDIAKLQNTAARYEYELTCDDIKLKIIGHYLDLFKLRNLLLITENNIFQTEKTLELMQEKFDEGLLLENDLIRYELLLSNFNLKKTSLKNSIRIINDRLAITVGLDTGVIIMPDTTLIDKITPLASEEVWQQDAYRNSKFLKLVGNNVDLNIAGESLVKAENKPKIGLKAEWAVDGPILTEVPPINRNLSYWYIGIGMSYDISSLYKGNRKMALAKSKTQTAKIALEEAKDLIKMQVESDYVKYKESLIAVRNREKSVELSQKNYDITKARYEEDMALITEMIDAVNSKIEAEQELVNTRIDILYYYYKLLFITGKL